MYERTLVTTADNPFNPFKDFANWKRWDEDHGYFTWPYLLRVAKLADSMSDREADDELSAASEEIVRFNLTGNYKKVTEKVSSQD